MAFVLPSEWQPTRADGNTKVGGTRLFFLNCLAHGWSPEESLFIFDRRMQLHVEHIRAVNPNVIGLVEVDGAQTLGGVAPLTARLLTALESETRRWILLRDAKSGGAHDTTCLLLDTNAVRLCHSEPIRFPSRGQVALVALLEVIETRKPMLVVVLHNKAGRTVEFEGVRIDMSRVVLETLCGHDTWRQYLPYLIWMGDFNAGPHSYGGKYPCAWYPQVVESRKAAVDSPMPWVNLVLPLESLYVAAAGDEPELTTFKLRNGSMVSQTIDYILAARGAFSVTALLPRHNLVNLPPEGLPSETWGSDHLSLGVEVRHSAKD